MYGGQPLIGNTSTVFKIHLPFLFPFFHQVGIGITSISINTITTTITNMITITFIGPKSGHCLLVDILKLFFDQLVLQLKSSYFGPLYLWQYISISWQEIEDVYVSPQGLLSPTSNKTLWPSKVCTTLTWRQSDFLLPKLYSALIIYRTNQRERVISLSSLLNYPSL